MNLKNSLAQRPVKLEWLLAIGFILLYAGFGIAYGFLADGTWDDDCAVRYYNVKNAFNEPKNFLSIWNRPLFVLIFFLPVHLGKYSILFGMVLISCASAWALYKSSILLKLKWAWMVVPFFLFQAFFFGVSRNALTEPLSVAILSWGLYFYLRKKWLAYVLVGSLLPLARLELSLLLILWVLPLVKEKHWKLILILGVPTFLYNLAGAIMDHDPIWLFNQTFGADNETNRYGHTSFGHYFQRYIYVLGPVIFYFFLLGLINRVVKRQWHPLIVIQFAAGFMLYVIFSAYLNMGNAAGFLRNLIPLTPLVAVLAVYGYNWWVEGIGSPKGLLKQSVTQSDDKSVEVNESANVKTRHKKQNAAQQRKQEELERKKEEEDRLALQKEDRKNGRGKYGLLLYTGITLLLTYTLFSYVLEGHHTLQDGVKKGVKLLYQKNNFYVILGVSALLVISIAMHWKKVVSYTYATIVGVVIVLGAGAFTLITEPPDNHMSPERILLEDISDMYVDSYLEEFPLYCNHSWFYWANDLEFYPENYRTDRIITQANLNAAPDSSIIIWENHYSTRLAGDVPETFFEKGYVMLYRHPSSDNKIMVNIYQKLGADSLNPIPYQDRFIEEFPDEPSPYFARAAVKAKSGDMDGALSDFNVALELDSAYTDVYFNRGVIYYSKHDYRSALADFQKTVELKPDFHLGHYNMAATYTSLGSQDSALVSYIECLRLKEDYWQAYLSAGNIYHQKQDYVNAEAFYGQALVYQPDNIQASEGRLQCLTQLNDWNKMVGEYTRLLSLKPESAVTYYYNRGLAYGKLEKYNEAIADFQQVTAANPNYGGGWYSLGLAYGNAGMRTEACQHLQRASSLGFAQANAALTEYCF